MDRLQGLCVDFALCQLVFQIPAPVIAQAEGSWNRYAPIG